MKQRNPWIRRSVALSAALAAAVMAAGSPAWANMLVQPQVTGAVTAVAGTTAVTINGQTYLIERNSSAYQVIQSVHVGEQIGLILDGPASSSSSHVIAIVTAAARK
ncbi:MAG TPA: hypothetical protein VHY19_16815 [Steroidobacteraceae bacterium]|jgi:hypothetical protein|nr:hypothetical protein [Steroidobacteraceae bacterium]